jgi:hypothetical protein
MHVPRTLSCSLTLFHYTTQVDHARATLSAHYQNPAARLLEEASPPPSPTRSMSGSGGVPAGVNAMADRPLSEVGTSTRKSSRIGSDYLDCGFPSGDDGTPTDDALAANVSRIERALRVSRGQSVELDSSEKWSAYRDRVSGVRGASGAFGFDVEENDYLDEDEI